MLLAKFGPSPYCSCIQAKQPSGKILAPAPIAAGYILVLASWVQAKQASGHISMPVLLPRLGYGARIVVRLFS